jgi:hypothetical protein
VTIVHGISIFSTRKYFTYHLGALNTGGHGVQFTSIVESCGSLALLGRSEGGGRASKGKEADGFHG